MQWFFVIACFLPALVIGEEDRYGNLKHLNDTPLFFCGVTDPSNTWYSILWRVEPTKNIDICKPWINYIKPSVFLRCRYVECETLRITNTKIYTLNSEMFVGLENVTEISFFNNTIDTIRNGTFDRLTKLKNLELSYNFLSGLDAEVREGLKTLKKLHLNKNPIILEEDSFVGLSRLELLELTNANLTTIPTGSFNGLNRLNRLDLSNNNLTSIPESSFEKLTQLKQLDLSLNSISIIGKDAFKGLGKLKDLWLNDNQIEILISHTTFKGIKNLKSLYLHSNPLLVLDLIVFRNMPKVLIEPGFEIAPSKTIQKNFLHSRSILTTCQPCVDYYSPYSCFVNYRVNRRNKRRHITQTPIL